MIKWIDIELTKWGDYMRESNGLGYPSSSIEHRMQQGCFGGGSAEASDGYVPGDVERTEAAVLELPHDERAAISEAYATGGTRDQQARRLGMKLGRRVSRDRLNKLLDKSHTRLDGIFIGMKINRKW